MTEIADIFDAAQVEGPFGFKRDRDQPVQPHFRGFAALDPEQARAVLDVRDGRLERYEVAMPAERVLVEHAGQGYRDPATGRQWGYTVRRVAVDVAPAGPDFVSGETPVGVPRSAVVPETRAGPAVDGVPAPEAALVEVSLPRSDRARAKATASKPVPRRDGAEPADLDDRWESPTPRWEGPGADERSATVRVLVLWLVVFLLAAQCLILARR